MRLDETRRVAVALDSVVVNSERLAGGFSHETTLVTLKNGRVVARFGGSDPRIEAAAMIRAGQAVPVPEVLEVLLAPSERDRTGMVLSYIEGTTLSEVLRENRYPKDEIMALGREVGRVVARIGTVAFDRPGFFADQSLAVRKETPWSVQLPTLSEQCMVATPPSRLDETTRAAWVALCARHAPALRSVDTQCRLVHADMNPKNLLVTRTLEGWRVDAVLDWEFSYSGCPYADAANMARFGTDYPAGFLEGFTAGYVAHHPTDLPLVDHWAYVGRVFDMFALSDLATRPVGHAIADQAARQIERWVINDVPHTL